MSREMDNFYHIINKIPEAASQVKDIKTLPCHFDEHWQGEIFFRLRLPSTCQFGLPNKIRERVALPEKVLSEGNYSSFFASISFL